MSRRFAIVLAFPALLLAASCAPQPGAGTVTQPRAITVTPTEMPAARGAPFNPLDTGGPASTGGGGY
jgi:hypothetical protein